MNYKAQDDGLLNQVAKISDKDQVITVKTLFGTLYEELNDTVFRSVCERFYYDGQEPDDERFLPLDMVTLIPNQQEAAIHIVLDPTIELADMIGAINNKAPGKFSYEIANGKGLKAEVLGISEAPEDVAMDAPTP